MAKITIYGLAGTGKSVVGKLLAKTLNIPYLSAGDMMRQNAKDLGISMAELEEKRMTDPMFDYKEDEYTKNYAKGHENFVFESRLPWYFIPDSFKIKLTCDFDTRIKRIVGREKHSFEEIKTETLFREKTDEELYLKLYGIKDMNADEHFDFILDTTDLTVEKIVQEIIPGIPK